MKKSIFLFFIMLFAVAVLSSCSSTKNATDSSKEFGASTVERDGSSYDKAIIVKSITEEYDWVRKRYPRAKMVQQALAFQEEKPFDLLTFMVDGKERTFYFDISKLYGKGF